MRPSRVPAHIYISITVHGTPHTRDTHTLTTHTHSCDVVYITSLISDRKLKSSHTAPDGWYPCTTCTLCTHNNDNSRICNYGSRTAAPFISTGHGGRPYMCMVDEHKIGSRAASTAWLVSQAARALPRSGWARAILEPRIAATRFTHLRTSGVEARRERPSSRVSARSAPSACRTP